MSLPDFLKAENRKKLLMRVSALAIVSLVAVGIMASNGWFPTTNSVTGERTGWFGAKLAKNAPSSWNPIAMPSPTPTPQLLVEYLYAGSRLLAVEHANANAAPPAAVPTRPRLRISTTARAWLNNRVRITQKAS